MRWMFCSVNYFPYIISYGISTELGFGNNAVEMQTTSVYDPKTKEFIINTPTTIAQKYWITNSAVHARWAIVFAQTIVKNQVSSWESSC